MTSTVEGVANAEGGHGAPGEKGDLSGGAAFHEWLTDGIQFSAAVGEVVMSDGEIGGFQAGVHYK